MADSGADGQEGEARGGGKGGARTHLVLSIVASPLFLAPARPPCPGFPPQSQNLEFSTRDLKKLEFWKAGDRGRPRVKLDRVVVDDDASAEELKLRSVSFGQGARALRRAGWQTDLKLKLLLRRPSGRRSR